MSPQHHVDFDDKFTTTSKQGDNTHSNWRKLTGFVKAVHRDTALECNNTTKGTKDTSPENVLRNLERTQVSKGVKVSEGVKTANFHNDGVEHIHI